MPNLDNDKSAKAIEDLFLTATQFQQIFCDYKYATYLHLTLVRYDLRVCEEYLEKIIGTEKINVQELEKIEDGLQILENKQKELLEKKFNLIAELDLTDRQKAIFLDPKLMEEGFSLLHTIMKSNDELGSLKQDITKLTEEEKDDYYFSLGSKLVELAENNGLSDEELLLCDQFYALEEIRENQKLELLANLEYFKLIVADKQIQNIFDPEQLETNLQTLLASSDTEEEKTALEEFVRSQDTLKILLEIEKKLVEIKEFAQIDQDLSKVSAGIKVQTDAVKSSLEPEEDSAVIEKIADLRAKIESLKDAKPDQPNSEMLDVDLQNDQYLQQKIDQMWENLDQELLVLQARFDSFLVKLQKEQEDSKVDLQKDDKYCALIRVRIDQKAIPTFLHIAKTLKQENSSQPLLKAKQGDNQSILKVTERIVEFFVSNPEIFELYKQDIALSRSEISKDAEIKQLSTEGRNFGETNRAVQVKLRGKMPVQPCLIEELPQQFVEVIDEFRSQIIAAVNDKLNPLTPSRVEPGFCLKPNSPAQALSSRENGYEGVTYD